ncbi:MAG: hypothetical protein RL344_54 [Pseudomonadota bacterium]|jgi:hypothetical protein
MDYRRFIPSSSTEFKVNDRVIECGHTTWQIRNIAATSVGKRIIPLNEPEPKFETPEPSLDINFKGMALASAAAWLVITLFFNSPNLAIFVAVGIAAAIIYGSVETLKTGKSNWLDAKEKIAKQWDIWDTMRKNPPILFSLMLETNAGSKPLFYSFDEEQILKTKNAIKQSMEKKETGDIKFEIETVNVGSEDSINNFGSSIYSQSIERG